MSQGVSGSPVRWLGGLSGGKEAAPSSVELAVRPGGQQQQQVQQQQVQQQQAQQRSQPISVSSEPRGGTATLSRCASSGAGLPSALGVPSPPAGSRAAFDPAAALEQASLEDEGLAPQQQQQPKVRWLPGLLSGSAEFQLPGSPAAGERTQSPSHSGEPQAGAGKGHRARGAALPPSGTEQLDRYLDYLLREAHPHKFMFYASWGVNDDAAAAIGEWMRRDRRIKVAQLSGNGIGDEGCELIAQGVALNSTLLKLDLASNCISNAGAVALAEALHGSRCSLAELDLSNNRIGDEGAEALAAAVAGSSLKRLHLAGNPISGAQQQVVAHVLKTREYKVPSKARHLRKASSSQLQFNIELTAADSPGQDAPLGRTSRAASSCSRKEWLHLPPAVAVVALSEPLDTTESSLAMQAGHLMAELSANSAAAPDEQVVDAATLVHLAQRLAARGYSLQLRTCFAALEPGVGAAQQQQPPQQQQDGPGHSPQHGPGHSFVRVLPEGDATSAPIIVDPCFKEQFQAAHATRRFREVINALPAVLCITEDRLWHLIELLCTELAAAFREARLELPPWRTAQYMHERWLSAAHEDVRVDAGADASALAARLRAAAARGGG